MTSPDAADNALVEVCKIGFKKGSNVVKTKTEIESINFSINGPNPGIFSIVFSIFFATESRKLKTCHSTA